jgi:hypothetical protein
LRGEIRQVIPYQGVDAGILFSGMPTDDGQNLFIDAERDVLHEHSICETVEAMRLGKLRTADWPSSPGDFHPGALTDPDVNLSIHPARARKVKIFESAENAGISIHQCWKLGLPGF